MPGSPKGAGAGPGVWGPGAGAEALAAEGQPTLASPRKLEESEGARGAPRGIAARRSEPASWYAPPPGRSPSMLGSLPGSRPGRAGSEPLPGPIGSEGSSAAVSKTPALLNGPSEILAPSGKAIGPTIEVTLAIVRSIVEAASPPRELPPLVGDPAVLAVRCAWPAARLAERVTVLIGDPLPASAGAALSVTDLVSLAVLPAADLPVEEVLRTLVRRESGVLGPDPGADDAFATAVLAVCCEAAPCAVLTACCAVWVAPAAACVAGERGSAAAPAGAARHRATGTSKRIRIRSFRCDILTRRSSYLEHPSRKRISPGRASIGASRLDSGSPDRPSKTPL
jgi:hypothetical protein